MVAGFRLVTCQMPAMALLPLLTVYLAYGLSVTRFSIPSQSPSSISYLGPILAA